MIVDLHSHTSSSHDGFTTQAELLEACLVRGIDEIAVTEHDAFCTLDGYLFEKNGVELIPGREFTTDGGAHVLGLFISNSIPASNSRHDIVHHIKAQNGIVIMPHPWKPNSGYLAVHEEDELIWEFDFIELVNGGWRAEKYSDNIVKIAQNYNLKMVASSDSHRGCQVGLCATRIVGIQVFHVGDAKSHLHNVTQDNLELLIDKRGFIRKGRRNRWFQVTNLYQIILPLIPVLIRRYFKRIHYTFSGDSRPGTPHYDIFKVGKNPW